MNNVVYFHYTLDPARVIRISEMEDVQYDDHFVVDSTKYDVSPGSKLIVAEYEGSHRIHGVETATFVGKDLKDCLNKVLEFHSSCYDSHGYADISSDIMSLQVGDVLKQQPLNITMPEEFIYGVYFPVDIRIRVFEVTLP